MNTRLYVGNLAPSVTEAEVKELFSKKGTVEDVTFMLDRTTGKPRGFAFVTMATPEQASAALEAFHSHPLAERYITVNEARPEEKNPKGQIGESYNMKRGF
ncbi:MAG TPA: RNA-binding protein [Candidatus Saccharimonadales bacterium]|nr:RNA-binding protein [Candidatus Saccharimonadales bacterium]